MRNILITGAARGLGKFLKNFLLDKGFIVYGTTRSIQEIRDNVNLKFFYLDLTDKNSINSVCDYFIQNNINIDVLIHNAGIADLDPIDVLDEEELKYLYEVNFLGPIFLTKRLIPVMKKSMSGKLIFISSIVSTDHWPYLGAYASSKAAIESVAFEWAVLLKRWNISVSVIQPNPLPTDMQILRSKNAQNSPYPPLVQDNLKWENIQDVCELIFQIINDPSPKFRYQTGPYSKKTADKFLKKNAQQKSLEDYQKEFIKAN